VCTVELHVTINNIKVLIVALKKLQWRIYVASNNKADFVFVWKRPMFCPVLTQSGIFRRIFIKVTNIKFYGNPCNRNRIDTCGETGRTKLIGPFHDFAKAANNGSDMTGLDVENFRCPSGMRENKSNYSQQH
jgi:hypothetical protein